MGRLRQRLTDFLEKGGHPTHYVCEPRMITEAALATLSTVVLGPAYGILNSLSATAGIYGGCNGPLQNGTSSLDRAELRTRSFRRSLGYTTLLASLKYAASDTDDNIERAIDTGVVPALYAAGAILPYLPRMIDRGGRRFVGWLGNLLPSPDSHSGDDTFSIDED